MATIREFASEMDKLAADLESIGRAAPVAVTRSLNRAATTGRVALTKAIKAETGLGTRFLNREIRIEKATVPVPTTTITAQGRPVPLIGFKARGPEPSRGRGSGVTTSLKGPKGHLPHAFITRVGKGRHRGVFQRVTRKRLPIREEYGPSAPEMFEKNFETFIAAAEASFLKNLSHEITFARSKQTTAASEAA